MTTNMIKKIKIITDFKTISHKNKKQMNFFTMG